MKMKKAIFGMGVVLALFVWTGFSGAAMVVDTGIPTAWPGPSGDPVLSSNQWLAAKFSLDKDYFINSAQGFMSSSGNGGTFTIAVYTDGGTIPGVQLFEASALAPKVVFDTLGNAIPGWYGFSGKDWSLSAGSYWIAFEVRQGDTFSGFMANPAAHPLPYEAIYESSSGMYWPESNFAGTGPADIGVRIEATPVPLPATILLLIPGFFGLAVLRGKFGK
jgi:hypothetical protein